MPRRLIVTSLIPFLLVAYVAYADNANPILRDEFVFTSAPFATCHATTIAETTDGTLVAAWFAGSKEGADDVAI